MSIIDTIVGPTAAISGLGMKLRELRRAKGLTLNRLAEETGSSKSYIWKLEMKPMPRPSARKIASIAGALGVTAEFLLDESRFEPQASEFDEAFFRRYVAADQAVKQKLNKILDVLEKE